MSTEMPRKPNFNQWGNGQIPITFVFVDQMPGHKSKPVASSELTVDERLIEAFLVGSKDWPEVKKLLDRVMK